MKTDIFAFYQTRLITIEYVFDTENTVGDYKFVESLLKLVVMDKSVNNSGIQIG